MSRQAILFILFLATVATVYVLAADILVRRWTARRRGIPCSETPAHIWFNRLVLALAATGALCIAYGWLVEPFWPEITHRRIVFPVLKGASRPIRLVHLSDFHCDSRPRLEERLPGLVASLHPDLIVVTGDFTNSERGVPVAQRCLRRLAELAPTFVVRGNWDNDDYSASLFDGTGVQEPTAAPAWLPVAGVKVWVAGMEMGQEWQIDRLAAKVPAGQFFLLLHHTPDVMLEPLPPGRIHLVCAGHTHGGQVCLPWYGAMTTLTRTQKRFEGGQYLVDGIWLNVSRGLGMDGDWAPRVRFCSRPEITLLELAPPP